MVATFATQRFFHKDGDPEWHAYREDSTTALCGEIQLSYNADSVADSIPEGGTLHPKCQRALNDETEPEVVSTPKAAAKPKPKTKAKS